MLAEYLENEKTMADAGRLKCDADADERQWINAIAEFLKPYSLINAHVVNFFKDRLWEAVDKEWMECVRKEPVEKLLQIPSGIVQDYWPESLKNYFRTLRSRLSPSTSRLADGISRPFHDFTQYCSPSRHERKEKV